MYTEKKYNLSNMQQDNEYELPANQWVVRVQIYP